MIKIAIIMFREFVEVAILIGIIMAATKNIKNSKYLISAGVIFGIMAAMIFSFFIKSIADSFDGIGSELFDVCIIMLTVASISWAVVWMQGYSKKIKENFKVTTTEIINNQASNYMLIMLVAVTILRETAEIILFLYSIASTDSMATIDYVIGVSMGCLSGLLVGAALYFGLLKIAGRYIFPISSFLLLLIAAGLASKAAGIMTSTGLLESFSDQLWDSSWLASDDSVLGETLSILTGYESKPNGLQVIFYFSTIIITYFMLKLKEQKNR